VIDLRTAAQTAGQR